MPSPVVPIPTVTRAKKAAEVRNYVWRFDNRSEVLAGETLSNPQIPAVAGLTVGTPAVLVAPFYEPGETPVPAGQGVQALVSGGTAGTTYGPIRCTVQTSGGATLECDGLLEVE